ncbi:MAG: tRNA (guanosine(46)-N7)-methyltransferase TrmB [bacterium]|nr:tRNA (guanosine(46)-N7)-methyltransferase TrmB [bacterium]
MARVRVHQHVNPLSPYYRQSPRPIDIESVFADPGRPLLLDIGCARGRFLLRMAEVETAWNYIGVEIREPLVEEANRLAAEAGLMNLHYAFCNAMLWLEKLLEGIPPGVLRTVTIQFPDPWFKRKHSKRRMVNPEMVDTISKHLAPDGRVFIQTDIESLAEEMFALFRADASFQEAPTDLNPFPIKTEREKAVEDKELPVYRTTFLSRSRIGP